MCAATNDFEFTYGMFVYPTWHGDGSKQDVRRTIIGRTHKDLDTIFTEQFNTTLCKFAGKEWFYTC